MLYNYVLSRINRRHKSNDVYIYKTSYWKMFLWSFAGGKQDKSDRSIVETALREAREELGIIVSENQVWGILKPLSDTVSIHYLMFYYTLIRFYLEIQHHVKQSMLINQWCTYYDSIPMIWLHYNAHYISNKMHNKSFQAGLSIAPVLANLGPLETLTLRPNPSEVNGVRL